MSFSREDIAAYEKAAPAAAAPVVTAAAAAPDSDPAQPAASAPASAPAATPPDQSAASPPADDADPAVPGGESSADTDADPAAANADTGSDKTPEAPAPKGSAQERIADLVAERNAFRKYGEYQGEQIARLTAQIEALKTGKAPAADDPASAAPAAPAAQPAAAPVNDPRPTLDQFDFDAAKFEAAESAWIERQIDRRVDKALGKKEAATAETAAKQAEKALADNFNSRLQEFGKTHADLGVVLANPALPQLGKLASRHILTSELGANIVYHLGKNPDLAVRISRMTNEQQLVAIGRVEAQLTSTPAPRQEPPRQKTTTQAPPPPTPVPAGAAAQKSLESMTMDEFVQHEREQALRQRQQRATMRKAMR